MQVKNELLMGLFGVVISLIVIQGNTTSDCQSLNCILFYDNDCYGEMLYSLMQDDVI